MKRPLIGITPLYNTKRQSCYMEPGYARAVEAAGALPLILPLTADDGVLGELSGRLDGFLFTGGPDIDPELYGERLLPEGGEPCQQRDEMELRLLRFVISRGKPLLGICRGIQLANAALGGSLYQDLPSQKPSEIRHTAIAANEPAVHAVKIIPGTPLAGLSGERGCAVVNSLHHQSIKRLAPGLAPMAVSEDGIIEAAWMPEKRFAWLVQWHPELMFESDKLSAALFSEFISACGEIV